MSNYARREKASLLRPWIEGILKNNSLDEIYWLDEEKLIFCINWPKSSVKCEIFKQWAINTGKFRIGSEIVEHSTWKARLRSALNRSKDFKYLEPESKKQEVPSRVYQILQRKNNNIIPVSTVLIPQSLNSNIPTVVEHYSNINDDLKDDVAQGLNYLTIDQNNDSKDMSSNTNYLSDEYKDFIESLNIFPPNNDILLEEYMDYNESDLNLIDNCKFRFSFIINENNIENEIYTSYTLWSNCRICANNCSNIDSFNFIPLLLKSLNEPVIDYLSIQNPEVYLITENMLDSSADEHLSTEWKKLWKFLESGLIIMNRCDDIFILALTKNDLRFECDERMQLLNNNMSNSIKVFDKKYFDSMLKMYDEDNSKILPDHSIRIYFEGTIYLKITSMYAYECIQGRMPTQNLMEQILSEESLNFENSMDFDPQEIFYNLSLI